jgi:hypothetical protein
MTEHDIREATISGALLRLRPKQMTLSVVMAALIPILSSTGVGSDIMKPIAAPIIGGMVTSTNHVLIVRMRTFVGGLAWIFQAFYAAASFLSVVGLLLAFTGTHAVVAFLVTRRTREFGIPIALGATTGRIVSGILKETLRTALLGIAAGLVIAAGLATNGLVAKTHVSLTGVPVVGPRSCGGL